MLNAAGKTYRNFLCTWTATVRRWAWAVVALALVFSGLSVNYLIENIHINTSTTDMLSADLPFRQHSAEMDAAFPQMSDTLLVVIDGQTPDIADRAALALAARMRANPQVFGGLYDLAGEDFFRRNGLLYLDLDELYDLSDRLAEAQPFIGTLWQDLSLRGLFTMLGKAIDFSSTGGGQPIKIANLLNAMSDVAEKQMQGKFSELSWRQVMQGTDGGVNANRRFLLLQPALDFASLSPASDTMAAVRDLAKKMALVPENGVRVRLSGSAALAEEELTSVAEGMGLAGILSLSVVIALLVIALRRLTHVIATVMTLLMGLIWTAAFAIYALSALNLISVAFAVLFIGLSVDFGIHYTLRYREARDGGADHDAGHDVSHEEGLTRAAEGAGGALTLSAIAAAIAFYAFLPTDYRGLAELGLIAGTGMFIALFANLTVLPALLTCFPSSTPRLPVATLSGELGVQAAIAPAGQGSVFARFIDRRARPLTLAFVVAGIAALGLAPRVDFDFDPLNLKSKNTESMSTLIELMADRRTSPYSIEILERDLTAAGKVADALGHLDDVASAETLADYVPSDQDEKLDVIASTELFLAPALGGRGQPVVLSSKDRLATARAFRQKLDRMLSTSDKSDHDAADRLLRVLNQIADREQRAGDDNLKELERRLLAALPAQLRALKDSLGASRVTLESLPKSLRDRQIAKDGRARIEVFPKADLQNRADLTRFVNAVRKIAPNATGSPVVILEAGRAVLRSFFQAGGLSIGLIAVLLLVVLGRLRDVLLVFAPLMLAGVFSLALSVLFGLSFNFANVIVLPLLFGLGVAGGIHLVARAATQDQHGGVLDTSTPRAVLFSALTTIGSFGSIALSNHPGTSSMGVLLTLAISMTLLCTLVFLPALMALLDHKASRGVSDGTADGR